MNKLLFVILLILFCGILSLLAVFADIALIEEHVLLWSMGAIVLAVMISMWGRNKKRPMIGEERAQG